MTTDTITPDSGNALSIHDGADVLAGLRQQQEQTEESGEQTPDTEEPEVTEEGGEPEPQEAGSESEESDDEESGVVQINLPDGSKITADEAAKGYLRTGDYTRKTQALSEKERQFQAQTAEFVQRLQGVYQEVASLLPQEPDWSSRVDEVGSDQAMKEQIQWNNRQKALNNARATIEQQNRQAMAQAQIKARETLLAGEFDASWKDPAKLTKAMEGVSDYLSNYGYGAEILTSLADPNIAVIAEKARRYDELQKAKPEAKKMLKDKPKPMKPGGKSQETGKERDTKSAMNRFHQTKTQDDALSALAKLRMTASS